MNLRYLIPPVAQRAELEMGHARLLPGFFNFFSYCFYLTHRTGSLAQHI